MSTPSYGNACCNGSPGPSAPLGDYNQNGIGVMPDGVGPVVNGPSGDNDDPMDLLLQQTLKESRPNLMDEALFAGSINEILGIFKQIRKYQVNKKVAQDLLNFILTIHSCIIQEFKRKNETGDPPAKLLPNLRCLITHMNEIKKILSKKKFGFIKASLDQKDLEQISEKIKMSINLFQLTSTIAIQKQVFCILNATQELSDKQTKLIEGYQSTQARFLTGERDPREFSKDESTESGSSFVGRDEPRILKEEHKIERPEEKTDAEQKTAMMMSNDSLHPNILRTPSLQPPPYNQLDPQPSFPPPTPLYPLPGYPVYGASPYHLALPVSPATPPPMPPHGAISMTGVSGSAISIGPAFAANNYCSGNINNSVVSNVNNDYSGRRSSEWSEWRARGHYSYSDKRSVNKP